MDDFEIIIILPPETPDDFATGLGRELRESADADPALGGRLTEAMVHDKPLQFEEVESPEFGAGAKQLTLSVVVFETEIVPDAGAK
jgi:hypothetical protein